MLRYLVIADDQVACCDGKAFSAGVPRGLGLAHVPIIDSGQRWEQRPKDAGLWPIVVTRQNRGPQIEVWCNKKLTRVVWGLPVESCAAGCRFAFSADGGELYAQSFGPGIWRVSMRVLVDKLIDDLRVFVYGTEIRVDVEHAAERYPCEVRKVDYVGTLITLCDGVSPGKGNDEELSWMLGGTINTKLPAGVADNYGTWVYSSIQYEQVGIVWRSIDFVIQPAESNEEFGGPLVLERDAWRPLFDGSSEDKIEVEHDLLEFYHARVYSRRGWATFGDWPHTPGLPELCRYNDHYFTVTALYRACVRSLVAQSLWSDMARVASNYVRDMCWQGGYKSHGKGLAPWSGPSNATGHWVDSESLVMAWLVDGDLFAKRTFDQWAAAFTTPTAPGRESRVAKRMCDVAYAFTGMTIWRDRATQIQDAELAREIAGEQVTGAIWHPEWCDKAILKDRHRPEGIINARAFPIVQAWRPQQRDHDTFAIVPDNAGPMGEGMLLLQMHALRTGERIYGADQANPLDPNVHSTRLLIDKHDDLPLLLTLRLINRIGGDIHPAGLRVFLPSGELALFVPDILPESHEEQDAAGYRIKVYRCGVEGPRGRWRVDVSSHALALYAPVSEWRETQEGTSWKFPAY